MKKHNGKAYKLLFITFTLFLVLMKHNHDFNTTSQNALFSCFKVFRIKSSQVERDKLAKMAELVSEKEPGSKAGQKRYYDRNARHRLFIVGDKVPLLLPTSNKKLLAQWKGLVKTVEKVRPVDYRVRYDNGVTKVYHVYMLKRWFDRDEEMDDQAMVGVCVVDKVEDNNEWIGNPLMDPRDTFRDVTIAGTLSTRQKTELMECLQEHGEVLTNIPGRTAVLTHRVVTTSDIPMRQKPS